MPQSDSDLKATIGRIRAREEKRLIRTAKKAGYFDRAIKSPELAAIFKAGLAKVPEKYSQLRKLEDYMAKRIARQSEEERKLDARRKILLGAFLMAQVKHKPENFTWLSSELEKFLDQHKDANVAAYNKEALADWLGPRTSPPPSEPAA